MKKKPQKPGKIQECYLDMCGFRGMRGEKDYET